MWLFFYIKISLAGSNGRDGGVTVLPQGGYLEVIWIVLEIVLNGQ